MSDSNVSITQTQDEISQDSYVQSICSNSCSILSFHPAEEEYLEIDDIHEVINLLQYMYFITHIFHYFFFELVKPQNYLWAQYLIFRMSNFNFGQSSSSGKIL